MKKAILISMTLVFGFMLNNLNAQTKMAVAVAYYYPDNCHNKVDLGYQYYSSDNISASKLRTKAKNKVKTENPKNSGANDWASYKENYLVIISGSSSSSNGCKRFAYGIGFGFNKSEALEKAKKSLYARNTNWDKKTFDIEESKSF